MIDQVAPAREAAGQEKKTVPGGRPRKSSKGPAEARIEFRVPKEDKKAFQDAADAAGKPLSEWIAQNLRRDAESSPKKRRPKKT